MSTGVPVGITDSQLAVLLRQAQWALDDAAHDVPSGRATAERHRELAWTLEALALVLRSAAPDLAGRSADESCGDRPDRHERSPTTVGEGGAGHGSWAGGH